MYQQGKYKKENKINIEITNITGFLSDIDIHFKNCSEGMQIQRKVNFFAQQQCMH